MDMICVFLGLILTQGVGATERQMDFASNELIIPSRESSALRSHHFPITGSIQLQGLVFWQGFKD